MSVKIALEAEFSIKRLQVERDLLFILSFFGLCKQPFLVSCILVIVRI